MHLSCPAWRPRHTAGHWNPGLLLQCQEATERTSPFQPAKHLLPGILREGAFPPCSCDGLLPETNRGSLVSWAGALLLSAPIRSSFSGQCSGGGNVEVSLAAPQANALVPRIFVCPPKQERTSLPSGSRQGAGLGVILAASVFRLPWSPAQFAILSAAPARQIDAAFARHRKKLSECYYSAPL